MGATAESDVQLAEMAALLRERNAVDERLGVLIDRPATVGDIGEWIAAHIFGIELAAAANNTAYDGLFADGELAGKTVNVKTYLRQYLSLDVTERATLDYYLVFTGPKSNLGSSRGTLRPFCIESAFLFDAARLLAELKEMGTKIGTATGIRVAQWNAAEIYPNSNNPDLVLSESQRAQLAMFAPIPS